MSWHVAINFSWDLLINTSVNASLRGKIKLIILDRMIIFVYEWIIIIIIIIIIGIALEDLWFILWCQVTCLAKKKLEGDFPPNFSFSSDHTRNTSIFKDLSTVFNEMVELKNKISLTMKLIWKMFSTYNREHWCWIGDLSWKQSLSPE
jgi:hypothetical protein